jgi:hypothetical protein
MRIRTIKPEFWRSDDITRLSREDRLLFIGLWSYVDDNGVGLDDYRAISADLFALEDDQNEVRDFVREGLATLSRALLIDRYEVDGKRFIHIRTWKKHQRVDRPNKPRYPEPPPEHTPPTSENVDDVDVLATPSRDLRETPPSGTEEQGNRGTGDKNTRAPREQRAPRAERDPDGFAEFWDAYPRKVGRRAAAQAYAAATKRGAEPAELLSAVRRYAALTANSEERFIAHPKTWLNQDRWQDEPPAPRPAFAVGAAGHHPGPVIGTSSQRANAILALRKGQP